MKHAKPPTTTEKDCMLGPFKQVDVVLLASLSLLVGFGIYAFVACHDPRVFVPVALGGAGLVGIWALLRFVKRDNPFFVAHVIFPVVLCALCVGNAIFFTPACVPDEESHYKKAYSMANAVMGDMGPLEMRVEDIVFNRNVRMFNGNVVLTYWDDLPSVELFSVRTGVQPNIHESWGYDPGADLPQFRLPSALGIVVGKSLGLTGYITFLLGRLFNAFYAIALIVIAVRLTPVGKNAFMAVALLPMCLHLIGSYSYDAGNIGLAMLTTGLLLRLFFGEGRVSLRLMIGFVLCSTLLVPGKIVYSAIGLLGVFVPSNRFASKRVAVCFKVAAVLIPIVFAVVPSLTRVTTTLMGSATDGSNTLDHRGKDAGIFYTLNDIVGHPVESLLFLLKTLVVRGPFYVGSLLGASLGWFQSTIQAPIWLDILLLLTLLIGALRAADDNQNLSRTLRIGFIAASVIGVMGIIMSMWTGWTFTTDEYIHGVQGRYFLPYLPCIMLAVRPRRLSVSRPLGSAIVMVFLSLNCLYAAHIFQAVVLA